MLWWDHLSWLSRSWLGPLLPPPTWLARMVLLLIPRLDIDTLALYHLHQRSFIGAKFLLQLPVGDDVFVLPLPFQGLVLLVSAYPTCQDQGYFTLVEDSGDFFQTSYVAWLRDDPYCRLLNLLHRHVFDP